MSESSIAIRTVQHYLYCPHRWGLMEIDCAWAENYFVTKANLIHSRVHDTTAAYDFRGKKCCTAVSVYNDKEEYNIYGVLDCLEISDNGSYCIVEYKPAKPKKAEYNFEDMMQVFAQKICVDYVFDCDCDAVIYYADVKKRVPLPFKENFAEYDQILKNALREMRSLLKEGKIPPKPKGQKCSGCSMKDICMPTAKVPSDIRKLIKDTSENE